MEDVDGELTPMNGAEHETETLKRALHGGRAENLDALELAVSSLFSGVLSYQLACYLATRLEQAMRSSGGLCGASFESAFRLSRAKGHPTQEPTADRNFQLAVWVHLAQKRGLSLTEAKGQAGDLFHVENVARCLREVGPLHEVNEAACEGWLARAGRPLPPGTPIQI